MDQVKNRFDSHWAEDPQTGCWNWTGALIGKGYGQFHVRPFTDKYAHRWSWRIHHGNLPRGLRVLHRCDNPRCVNPNHLFVGSSGDNAQDMKAKGRHLYGERNTKCKLTETSVLEIFQLSADGMSQRLIAEKVGISQVQVSRILRGDRWAHVHQAIAKIRRAARE